MKSDFLNYKNYKHGSLKPIAFHSAGIFLLLSMIFLNACSSHVSQETPRKITLEFWTLQLDAFKDTLNPMFRAYEQSHPHVKIHWVDVPFSEGEKRTLTAMLSPNMPDVINLNPDFSALLAGRNALIDMNKAIPERVKATYLPVTWQAATLSKQLTFGLPWYVTSNITLYNRAILKQAGLSQIPATFKELPLFLRTIRQKTPAYGMMPTLVENGNFLKDLQAMGVRLYDGHGRAIFATSKAIARLSAFSAMYQAGWIPSEAITEGHQAAVGRFQAGTLAMLMIGPNFLRMVQQNAPDIYREISLASQFPQGTTMPDFSLMVLVVPSKSAHPAEAVDFAMFMTNAENQLALARVAPVLPSITSDLQAIANMNSKSDSLMDEGRHLSAVQLLQAHHAYPIQPDQQVINDIIDEAVQRAMLGKIPADEALRQAQQAINLTFDINR